MPKCENELHRFYTKSSDLEFATSIKSLHISSHLNIHFLSLNSLPLNNLNSFRPNPFLHFSTLLYSSFTLNPHNLTLPFSTPKNNHLSRLLHENRHSPSNHHCLRTLL